MVSNPDFSFPILPQTSLLRRSEIANDSSRRPASMHIQLPTPQNVPNSHRRSTSTLPSFAFNSTDTSGLHEDAETPPQTPDENAPVTPSRRGHRRGGSEFVGGDSRLGVSNALSSSPTKTNASQLPIASAGPPPSGRRGHAHRRSAAISSHDVGNIIQPAEVQPRLSSSLPNTPLEHPAQATPTDPSPAQSEPSDPFGPPLEDTVARPPSRPRVGFADNVEYIPRPLSTISSETESSISTLRGHSQHNSINSVISAGASSPPSSRVLSLISPGDMATPGTVSSRESTRKTEKEGEWLRRPLSESAISTAKTTFVAPEPLVRDRDVHLKKHSLSHALGFDRRRSEPTIGMIANESSRLSAISLQESASRPQSAMARSDSESRDHEHEHVSSAKKLKLWAASKISRKTKEANKAATTRSSGNTKRPMSEGSGSVLGEIPTTEASVAETDLDAVLSSRDTANDSTSSTQRFVEPDTPAPSQHSSFHSRECDDSSPVLDLDAALGPFQTPPMGPQRRKELHSSRLTKDFSGPGGHYHRRTESAPALAPFERVGTPPQSPMADVFEEDEEDEDNILHAAKTDSVHSAPEDENGVGIEVMDENHAAQQSLLSWRFQDGLGISRGEWEPERPTTSHGNVLSRFSSSGTELRGSSIIEETIMEETSPGETIEIVEAHEEPRASSLTKSSDSSETPTLLAPSSGLLTLPDGQQSLMTPDTYQTSAFSSPDFGRRQGSFDTSRLGTSASSIADNRTMSSCATGDHSNDLRVSVDDVPSLTSSRSTMLSTAHANNSRREFSASRTPSASSGAVDPALAAERRRKRSSIQSLSQLVGGSFGSKSKGSDESRPHTAAESVSAKAPKKKEHRLKKLMFWKYKHSKHSTQQV